MTLRKFWGACVLAAASASRRFVRARSSSIRTASSAGPRQTARCGEPAFAGLLCGLGGVCVAEGGCHSNAECVSAHNNEPWICNKETRTCANLQLDLGADAGTSAKCTPYFKPGDELRPSGSARSWIRRAPSGLARTSYVSWSSRAVRSRRRRAVCRSRQRGEKASHSLSSSASPGPTQSSRSMPRPV